MARSVSPVRGLRSSVQRRLVAAVAALAAVVAVVQGLALSSAGHSSPALASAASGTAGLFVPVEGRLLDTRTSSAMAIGVWRKVQVTGQLGIPSSSVAAVVVNFTVLDQTGAGLIHADKDEATPNATVTYMNYTASGQQSNSGTLAVGSDGAIQVESNQTTDLLIDVQGYYTGGDNTAAGGFVPVTPKRLVDTRNGTGLPKATLAGGSTTTVQVTGLGGVPAGATGVVANVGIADNTATGSRFFTAFPADISRPQASVNFSPGATHSFAVNVGLSSAGTSTGSFDFFLSSSGYTVDLIVDVVGYFTPGTTAGAFTPATARVYDSRTAGHTTVAGGATVSIPVGGIGGVPAAGSGIAAVTANLAVIDGGTANSFVMVSADGIATPSPGSSLNYVAGSTVSNMITSRLGANGAVKLYNAGSDAINVVLDVEGWYTGMGQAIPGGQHQTQRSLTLQADPSAGGSWVTYQYRVGSTGSFLNVPTGDVTASSGSHPSWPVTKSGGTFTAYTWNLQATLAALASDGIAADTLVQVQACYGSSATDTNLACGAPSNVQFVRSTFSAGYATTPFGPGTLSESTGDFQLSAADADAASSLSTLSVGRSLTTLADPTSKPGPTGVFGPGWTADLSSSDAGDGDLTVSDAHTQGYLAFTDAAGGVSLYQATSAVTAFPITFTGVGDADGDGVTVTMSTSTKITMAEPDGTVTTWVFQNSAWQVTGVTQPGWNTTSTYTYVSGLVTRIQAPVPAGVTDINGHAGCDLLPDHTAGCRSLLLTYSNGLLASVQLSAPQANTSVTGPTNLVTLATYGYTNVYLTSVTDALTGLVTSYSYDSTHRLASVTPPGQNPWTLTYDAQHRLSTVSRSVPVGTSGSPTDATQSVVYEVPTTGSGLPDVTAATAANWGQNSDVAQTGTAIFPADYRPTGAPAAADWPYAAVHYLDVNGREVNTAAYGAGAWQIDSHQFDNNGNDIWDLAARNRAQALTATSATDPYVAGLTAGAPRAALLASTSVYNPLDPSEVTDTYGPTHPVRLASGTVIDAQDHQTTVYDEGAPNSDLNPATSAAYRLPTTVTDTEYNVQTQADTGWPEESITHTGYAAAGTMTADGWALGQATGSTVQMGASPSSNDLVTTTVYDADGRVIATWLPGDSSGTTPRTTVSTYFTATGSGSCVSAVQAGLLCRTAPGGQPTRGNPLPVVTYTYNQYGQQLTKTETYGSTGTVRTTTDTYNAAEQLASSAVSVTGAPSDNTAVSAVNYSYDPTTGLPTTTSTGTGANTKTMTTTYWPNSTLVKTYTDATGNMASTVYDIDGRQTSVTDGAGTTSWTYDGSGEHRGLVTAEDIGAGGDPSTFTASYDAEGNLTTETYPNGLIAATTYDNAGNATKLGYAMGSTSWMSFTSSTGLSGRTAAQSSPQSNQTFAFDADGRLTQVQDTYNGACTTRQYTFDTHSNRTALTSYPAASGGSCSTATTASTISSTFDGADRITNSGYAYDTLGRTTTVPAADAQGIGTHATITGAVSVGYFSNDMVASQTQASTTESFTLDPSQNRISSESDGTTTTTNHYDTGDDSPDWTSTGSTSTRNVTGPDGGLVATISETGNLTLQLANLHGDTVATAADTTAATGVATYSESTEYGAPRTPASAPDTYGWLGAKQRSTDDLGGLVLMGVRLYDTATGRFLSTDPIPGGNADAYVYAVDPVNEFDLSGQCCGWHSFTHFVKKVAKAAWNNRTYIASGLSVASAFVPVLAPWALAVNLVVAGADGYGCGRGDRASCGIFAADILSFGAGTIGSRGLRAGVHGPVGTSAKGWARTLAVTLGGLSAAVDWRSRRGY